MSHNPVVTACALPTPTIPPSGPLLLHPCLTRGMMKLCVSSRKCRLRRALCASHGRFFCTPCQRKQGT